MLGKYEPQSYKKAIIFDKSTRSNCIARPF